jgi:hypothetical protein
VPGGGGGASAGGGAPGRPGFSVSATGVVGGSGGPGGKGRGRRVTCTVALAVAGALVVVCVGTVIAVKTFLGGTHEVAGKPTHPTAGEPAPTRSTGGKSSPPAAEDPPPSSPGDVPAAYLGRWQGAATATEPGGGSIPDGTFELVVHQGGKGTRIATLTTSFGFDEPCKDELTLKSADAKQLVASGHGASGNPSHCSQTAHTVYLKRSGDALQYTSDDPGAGNPKARLTKTG